MKSYKVILLKKKIHHKMMNPNKHIVGGQLLAKQVVKQIDKPKQVQNKILNIEPNKQKTLTLKL